MGSHGSGSRLFTYLLGVSGRLRARLVRSKGAGWNRAVLEKAHVKPWGLVGGWVGGGGLPSYKPLLLTLQPARF